MRDYATLLLLSGLRGANNFSLVSEEREFGGFPRPLD